MATPDLLASSIAPPVAGVRRFERAGRTLNEFNFYSLLVLLAIVALPYTAGEAWRDSLFIIGIFAVGILTCAETLLTGTPLIRKRGGMRRLLAPVVVIVAFALLQSYAIEFDDETSYAAGEWRAISADPYGTRLWALHAAALALAGMLLARYTSNEPRRRMLIRFLIFVGIASALFGFARQTLQSVESGFVSSDLSGVGGYAQFGDRNHFAFLMEMTFGLLLGSLLGVSRETGLRRDAKSAWHLCGIASVLIAIAFARSRGGMLAVLSQTVFAVLLWGTLNPPRYLKAVVADGAKARRDLWVRHCRSAVSSLAGRSLLVICLLMILCAGIVWIGGERVVRHFDSVTKEAEAPTSRARTKSRRREVWGTTLMLARANPVFGVGFGGYATAITGYHDASGRIVPAQAHNDYLEAFAAGGVVGAALCLWFVAVLIKNARKNLRRSQWRKDTFATAGVYGAMIGLFGVAFHSLVDFGLHTTIIALVAVALVVIATTPLEEVAP